MVRWSTSGTGPLTKPKGTGCRAVGDGMEHLEIRIDGMQCDGCVAGVQTALTNRPGVAARRGRTSTAELSLSTSIHRRLTDPDSRRPSRTPASISRPAEN